MKREEGFGTNLTKFYIIALLSEKPRHGYDTINEIGRRLGKRPSAGQIYPLLQNMRKKGLVNVSIHGRKKTYALTPKGKSLSKAMINHFSEPTSLQHLSIRLLRLR